jgi:hypothetical protein
MKKILLLLIGLTIISCGGNTTDPIIGTWKMGDTDDTITFNSNGSFENVTEEETFKGNWVNNDINFDLLNQSYTVRFSHTMTDTWPFLFSRDFSSFTFSDVEGGPIYRKQ